MWVKGSPPSLHPLERKQLRTRTENWRCFVFFSITALTEARIVVLTMDEESKQRMREHIMGEISDTINNFLEGVGSTAIRILGDTPTGVLDPEGYLESVRPFVSKVEESIHQQRPDTQTRFLAFNVYPGKHSYFVLDLNNVDYDYETAHIERPLIPVYVLRLSPRKIRMSRQKMLDGTLAKTLAEMHNGHGGDPLPLFEDRNHLVEYRRPRNIELLISSHSHAPRR